jgi:hypothetical protein
VPAPSFLYGRTDTLHTIDHRFSLLGLHPKPGRNPGGHGIETTMLPLTLAHEGHQRRVASFQSGMKGPFRPTEQAAVFPELRFLFRSDLYDPLNRPLQLAASMAYLTPIGRSDGHLLSISKFIFAGRAHSQGLL